jgi:hypothetical protein
MMSGWSSGPLSSTRWDDAAGVWEVLVEEVSCLGPGSQGCDRQAIRVRY